MPRKLLRRPSAAMIVACAALTVALAPASFATVSALVPRDSVGTAQLKTNSVTSDKVRDFTLRIWDFKKGDVPRGPAGAQGPAGVVGNITMRESSTTVPGNLVNGLYVTRAIQVRCQSGERAVGGGSTWSSDENDKELATVYTRPLVENGRPVGWRARGGSDLRGDRVFTVQVLCAQG